MTTDIVAKLQEWRDIDHADAITLTRGEVIMLLEVIYSLRDRPRDDGTYVHRLDEREGDQ
jgi:hypothetical protein